MLPTTRDDSLPPAPANGTAARPGLPVGPALAPLNVTALVVAKADLVAALRLYVPQLADIATLDGDQFLLRLAPGPTAGNGRPA